MHKKLFRVKQIKIALENPCQRRLRKAAGCAAFLANPVTGLPKL